MSGTDDCEICASNYYCEGASVEPVACALGKFSHLGSSSLVDCLIPNAIGASCSTEDRSMTCRAAGHYCDGNFCQLARSGFYSLQYTGIEILVEEGKCASIDGAVCIGSGIGATTSILVNAGRCASTDNLNCVGIGGKGSSYDASINSGHCASLDGSSCAGSGVAGGVTSIPCPRGTYSPGGVIPDCTNCPGGMWSLDGQNTCQPCPAGTYSTSGASNCTQCQPGYYSASFSLECTICAAGYYSTHGQPCNPCMSGTYSLAGASGCTPCDNGEFSGPAASSCDSCSS